MAGYILDPNRKAPSFDPFSKDDKRAVTFDLYGCLLNFRQIPHFISQIARENNLKPEVAEPFFNLYFNRVMYAEQPKSYRELLHRTLEFVDMEMDTVNVFTGCLEELYLLHTDLRPHSDVIKTLEFLKSKNIEMFLLANSDKYLSKRTLEYFRDFFDDKHIFTIEDSLCFKPTNEYWRAATDKFKLRTYDHFHVTGNYFTDVVPAKKLHWDTIYVNRRKTGVLQSCLPDMMIRSLTELDDAMTWVRINQIEEEKAAQQREAEAKAKEDAAAKAEAEAKAAREAEIVAQRTAAHKEEMLRQQQQQLKQHLAASSYEDGFGAPVFNDFDAVGAFDNNYTPFNLKDPRDAKIAAKMQSVSPARARAIAAARERALANSKKGFF